MKSKPYLNVESTLWYVLFYCSCICFCICISFVCICTCIFSVFVSYYLNICIWIFIYISSVLQLYLCAILLQLSEKHEQVDVFSQGMLHSVHWKDLKGQKLKKQACKPWRYDSSKLQLTKLQGSGVDVLA